MWWHAFKAMPNERIRKRSRLMWRRISLTLAKSRGIYRRRVRNESLFTRHHLDGFRPFGGLKLVVLRTFGTSSVARPLRSCAALSSRAGRSFNQTVRLYGGRGRFPGFSRPLQVYDRRLTDAKSREALRLKFSNSLNTYLKPRGGVRSNYDCFDLINAASRWPPCWRFRPLVAKGPVAMV